MWKTCRLILGMVGLFALVLGTAACGGGGGSSGGTGVAAVAAVNDLDGAWFGPGDDFSGLTSWRIAVQGGTIVSVERGGVAQGVTGTIRLDRSLNGGGIYAFELSDGTEGGFFVDDGGQYAVFVTENGAFGVVQRNATTLPRYFEGDVFTQTDTERGVLVDTDGNLEIQFAGTAQVTVTNFDFVGSDSAGTRFQGAFDSFLGAATGGWVGRYSNDQGQAGTVTAFLSPDKRFFGVYACQSVSNWPACSYLALE